MPDLDLGKRRVAAKGEPFVVRLNAEDSEDGKAHAWPLPRVMTQVGLRKLSSLANFLPASGESEDTSPEAMAKMVEVMDDLFVILFGVNAEDAAKHLGPEDFEPIMGFYGIKMGESLAS